MFEHSLIDLDTELERKQQPRRRWISLPLAVGLHLVALTAFALGSYWSVGPVPEPSLNVAFIDVALPPVPPPSGGGHPRPTTAPRPVPAKPATTPIEQPKTVPDKPPGPVAATPTDPPPDPRRATRDLSAPVPVPAPVRAPIPAPAPGSTRARACPSTSPRR